MRICELREKEVINTCDCKVLGCVVDIDFDLCSGQIEAIIVPGPGKVCGIFGVDSEYIIPFACIRKIGPDIILVEIQKEKFLKKNIRYPQRQQLNFIIISARQQTISAQIGL